MTSNSLVEFWREADLSVSFLHPKDHQFLNNNPKLNKNFAYTEPGQPGFGYPRDIRLQTSLVPQPYSGDLQKSKIVILQLNPGLSLSDYFGEKRPDFLDRLKRNLRQEFTQNEPPFLWLDPEMYWHGGFIYWEKKLRGILMEYAHRHHGGNYLQALKRAAGQIAVLEMIPYHSSEAPKHSLFRELPSVKMACQWAAGQLRRAANTGDRIVIVTRRGPDWGLADDPKNGVVVYEPQHARAASLGPKTSGGKKILAFLAP